MIRSENIDVPFLLAYAKKKKKCNTRFGRESTGKHFGCGELAAEEMHPQRLPPYQKKGLTEDWGEGKKKKER